MSFHLSDQAYQQIRQFFYEHSGIDLSENKRHLVEGRLRHRVLSLGFDCYGAYFNHVQRADQSQERQLLIDLLTTNETYFFREPQHFKLLSEKILPELPSGPRIWCAAASSGEEPYSLAMLLADKAPDKAWQLTATDLSQRILARAEQGLYPMQRLELMPESYLKRFCLRGTGDYEGYLLIRPELRERLQFRLHNLLHSAANLGLFDVIFLRNVLIYFNQATKQKVLDTVLAQLKPGGWLIIGHAESLHGLDLNLLPVRPSVYRAPLTRYRQRSA